jgi:trimethylamine:corrinoid methyltransferase-like protein
MKILHEQALELLAAAGCKVENDHIVKISSDLVLQAIDSTPKNIAVYDREANHCMDVGGRRAYFGTGYQKRAAPVCPRGRLPCGPGGRCPAQYRFYHVVCTPI